MTNANVEVDITDIAEQKIEAILCHKSQIADPEKAVERWKERWGEQQADGTFRHYERFRCLRFG